MDGRTPESEYTWTDAGGFYGTAQGVASPQDLVNRISPEAPPEPEAPTETAQVQAIGEYRARAEAADKQAEIQAQSLSEATSKVEELRETLGLIRFRAVEALSADNPPTADTLRHIVELVNEAIEAKVPA